MRANGVPSPLAPVPIELSMPLAEFAQGLRQRTLPAEVRYQVATTLELETDRIMEQVFDDHAAGE